MFLDSICIGPCDSGRDEEVYSPFAVMNRARTLFELYYAIFNIIRTLQLVLSQSATYRDYLSTKINGNGKITLFEFFQ